MDAKKVVPSVPNTKGELDVDALVKQVEDGLPPNRQEIFKKLILSGMRVMFSKESHGMLLEQIDKPGDLAQNMVEGGIGLVYLLWEQSNKTLPGDLLVPAAVVLTMRGFEFLQNSDDPRATNALLGKVMHGVVKGVMDRAGATEAEMQKLAAQGKAKQQPGMIGA